MHEALRCFGRTNTIFSALPITIFQPLLIVALGGVVMLIVLTVLLTIIQLNTWAK